MVYKLNTWSNWSTQPNRLYLLQRDGKMKFIYVYVTIVVLGWQMVAEGQLRARCVCPAVQILICGVDGKTYRNQCLMNDCGRRYLKIAHYGRCTKMKPKFRKKPRQQKHGLDNESKYQSKKLYHRPKPNFRDLIQLPKYPGIHPWEDPYGWYQGKG